MVDMYDSIIISHPYVFAISTYGINVFSKTLLLSISEIGI